MREVGRTAMPVRTWPPLVWLKAARRGEKGVLRGQRAMMMMTMMVMMAMTHNRSRRWRGWTSAHLVVYAVGVGECG